MEHIIFDLGKVLVNYNFQPFYKELGYIPSADFIMESTDTVLEFEAGRISPEEFYHSLKNIYNFTHDIEEFKKIWCSVFTDLTELVDFAKELKEDYKVYILSNTDIWHFKSIWKQFPELHFFENNLMLSYELNAVKPKEEIFQKALRIYDIKPEECLFIDDKPENINGAKMIGIDGIIYTNAEDTINKIKKMLGTSEGN